MPARQIFSFTGWDRDHPGERPPGDRIDAQFAEIFRSLKELGDRIDLILRSDGAVRNGLITRDALAADLAEEVAFQFRQEIAPDLVSAASSSRAAEAASAAASRASREAGAATARARNALDEIEA